MGTSLNGLNPASTYQALIKVGNNTNLNTTLKTLSDGAGNDLPMQASTTAINFTGTVSGVASGVSGAIQFSNGSAFASDASNLFWDDANNRLGIGTNAPTQSLEIGGNNNIKLNNDGSLYLNNVRYATNNGSIYVGDINATNTEIYLLPQGGGVNGSIRLGGGQVSLIKGSGTTSGTTSLLVQNSGGTNALQIRDDRVTNFEVPVSINGWNIISSDAKIGITPYSSGLGTLFNSTTVNGASYLPCTFWTSNFFIEGTGGTQIANATGSIDASAKLQVDSTTKGFLPPRMTTTQKNAIASPAEGLEMYDSTAKSPAYYDGTNWGYTGGALQNAAGNSGTLNISFAAGNIVNLTLNANTTLAFSNAVIGTYIIQVTQGATGANVLTYPASVKWAGGTAPTLTTTVGKTDILTFYYDGTNYYGNYSLNY